MHRFDDPPISLRRIGLLVLVAAALAPAAWRLSRPFAASAEAGEVVLTYMCWGNPQQLEAEREIIRLFNEKNRREGRKLRVELFMPPAGGYAQKLRLMLASGTAPDIIRVDHYDFPSLVPRGYFRDLTDLAAADPDFNVNDFHPAAQRENYYNGRLYAVNVLFGGVICYYNKDLFRQALLDDPYELWKKGQWTWDKFEEVAQALTVRREGRTVQYGVIMPGTAGGGVANWTWFIWVWGEGGEILSEDRRTSLLDSPANIRAFQRYRDLRFRLRVAPTPADAAAAAFNLESGNVAMTFEWAGMAPRYRAIADFEWDIAPTPHSPDRPYALVKGNQLVMTATCRHPKEAWEWMKFMVSPEVELLLHGDRLRRNVPTRNALLGIGPDAPADIRQTYLYAEKPFFHTDVIPFVLNHARHLPIDPAWPVWTTEAQKYIDMLFVNENASAADILPRAKVAVDRVLEREHRRLERYLSTSAEVGHGD